MSTTIDRDQRPIEEQLARPETLDPHTRRAAHHMFQSIPTGVVQGQRVAFNELSINTAAWLYPPIYDVYGEQVQLHGPIHVVEQARRDKIRFVAVQFFFPHEQNQDVPKPDLDRTEWGWQGENQIIHLLTDNGILDRDPMEPSYRFDRKSARLAHLQERGAGFTILT